MTFNTLVNAVTKVEGKKKQVPIAQVREVLKSLRVVYHSSLSASSSIFDYLDTPIRKRGRPAGRPPGKKNKKRARRK